MIGPLADRRVIQLGFVVADLDSAVAAFAGAWRTFPPAPQVFDDVDYHAGEAVLDHRVALRDEAFPQLELIQPLAGANVWREWLDAGRTGLHHCAVEVESATVAAAAMERAGYRTLMRGRFGGDGEFAYFDTVAACGVHVEALRFPRRWT